jgi:DNA-binding IclR family transcriptional regulator
MVWAIHSTDRSVTVNQSVRKAITLLRVPDADRVVLGPELVRLARDVDPGALLLVLARGRLADLCTEVRETVTLSVVAADGGLDVVYQADGPQHLVVRSWTGQRFPLHASSSGKVLLAGYDGARLAAFLRRPRAALTPARSPQRARSGASWRGCARRVSPPASTSSRRGSRACRSGCTATPARSSAS